MAIKLASSLLALNIPSNKILKTDANGNIVAAVDGTDYNTAAGQWISTTGGIFYSDDVRIGTYQSDVTPEARLHVYQFGATTPKVLIEDGYNGDASVEFKISTQSYMMGIDNSDSDKFVLAASTALGTTNVLEVSTTGLTAFQKSVLFKDRIYLTGDGSSTREALLDAHGTRGILYKQGNATYWQVAQGGNQFEITDAANGNDAKGNVMLRVDGNDSSDNEIYLALNGGKVGIGTTEPSSSLHVNAENASSIVSITRGGTTLPTSTQIGRIKFDADYNDSPINYGYISAGSNNISGVRGSIEFGVKSTSGNVLPGMTLYGTNTGVNVGIGTTTPSSMLEVDGLHGTWMAHSYGMYFRNNTDAGYTRYIHARSDGALSIGRGLTTELTGTSPNRYFTTDKDQIHITSGGLVGIGTTSPSRRLHVAGNALISGGAGDATLTIEADTDNSGEEDNPNIILTQDGGAVTSEIGIVGSEGQIFTGSLQNAMYLNTRGAGMALQLGTTATTVTSAKLTIEAAGDVGIGTTAPSSLLHLYKSSATSSGSVGTTLLKLENYVGSDLSQQKTFVDFILRDDNNNETPQVRIGAEVGTNGDANTQLKEGSGAFVVYTNNAESDNGDAGTSLAERFRVDYQGNLKLSNYTAGLLKTDANGNVSLDTNTYLTSLPTHNHDTRYYTKTQSDTKYLTKGDAFIPIAMTGSDYEASAEEVVLAAAGSYKGLAFPNGAKDFEFEVSIKGNALANHQGIFWGATDLTSLIGAGLTGYKTTHQNTDNLHIRDIANNSTQMTINPGFSPADGQYHRYRLVQYRNPDTSRAILKVYLDGNLIFDTTEGQFNNPPQVPTYFGFIVYTGDVNFAHWNVREITDSEDLIKIIGENVFQPLGNYLTSLPAHNHDARYYTETEMDEFFDGTTAKTGYNKTNWDTAYGWGNHASANYLTTLPSHTHNKIVENALISYGQGSLQWLDVNDNGGTGYAGSSPENPFNDWHHHIVMNHANSTGYYVDMAFSFHNDRVHFRRKAGGGDANLSSWKEFWHTGNLSKSEFATASHNHTDIHAGHGYINSGDWNDLIATHSSDPSMGGGIYRVESSTTNPPASGVYNWSLYQQGTALRGSQIALSAYGSGNRMFFRGANVNTGVYRDWAEVYHTDNLTISTLDGYTQNEVDTLIDEAPYLPVAGKAADSNLLDGIDSGSFLRSDTSDTMRFDTFTGEVLKFENSTSGGRIQIGFQQNDTDGLHHRAYFRAYKSAAGLAAGKFDIVIRSAGGGFTDDIFELEAGAKAKWQGNNLATESYVTTSISNLVDSAPGTLDTLNELAAALGDDANFSTTVTNSIATKLSLSGGQISRNGMLTVSPGSYSYANGASLELYTTDNHVPAIGFHRGGVSATTLWEEQGELFITKWNGDGTQYKLWHTGDFDPGNLGYADGSTYQTYGTGNNGWLMPDYNNNASNFMRMYYDDGTREFRMYSYHGAAGEAKIALYDGGAWNTLSSTNIAEFKTAYGWGNHASAGYITSVPSEYLTESEGDGRYTRKFYFNIGSSGGNLRYLKLFTTSQFDDGVVGILSSGGDYGDPTRASYQIHVGTRTSIDATVFQLSQGSVTDDFSFYYRDNGSGQYEVWCRASDYNYTGQTEFVLLSDYGDVTYNFNSVTTTAPTNLVPISKYGIWHGGNFNPSDYATGTDLQALETYSNATFLQSVPDNISVTSITVGGTRVDASTDRPGLLEIERNGTSDWAGLMTRFSGTAEWALMGNESSFGLYDDEHNEWAWRYVENGRFEASFNGSVKLQTTSAGTKTIGDKEVTGELSVGNAMWVNGNNATVYNNYNENLRLPPAGNDVSVIAFRAVGEGGEPSSSILGYNDRHEVRIGGTWRQRIYSTGIYYNAQVHVTGQGDSSQWNTAYGWGNHASGGYFKTSATTHLLMNNFNITGVNHITINDAGFGEGIQWDNMMISESPDNLSNAAGNLQISNTGNSAIRVTVDTSGNLYPSRDRLHLLGLETNRWQVVFCEILDSAGLHEKNLQNPEGEKSVGDYATGTVLVWKSGKNVPCTEPADHMRMGIAVKGVSSPLVQGAEPVLCTGEVNEGDYLVTSSVEGHAAAISPQYMRQHNLFDCVLGKALEGGNGDSHIIKTWVNI